MDKKDLVAIFARCFRLITKLSAATDDGFFVDLLNHESERLLLCYINFLKNQGSVPWTDRVAQPSVLQYKNNVAKHPQIVQHWNNVAQCRQALISQIKNLLNLLNILNYLNLTKPTTPLLLERDLLKLQLLLLGYRRPVLSTGNIKVNGNPAAEENKNVKEVNWPANPNELHRQIAEFIKGKERVRNLEVFSRFEGITRRTLKKKLSELTNAGAIKRSAQGKKVFYSAIAS